MQTTMQTPIELGANVYGSDGAKIGSVAETQSQYFVIEKGFIFTTDIYIPMSAVAGRHEDGILLSMTKDEIEHGDWSSPPVLGDQNNPGQVGYAGQHDAGWDAGSDSSSSMASDSDVIERREERLTVDKQAEPAGSVHVGKHVVSEEQSVDVPVTREEVTINRRSVDRATGETLSEDEIDVPVSQERVQVGKETRVVEELEVGKTARTDTERVSDTVRREEFDIDDDTARP